MQFLPIPFTARARFSTFWRAIPNVQGPLGALPLFRSTQVLLSTFGVIYLVFMLLSFFIGDRAFRIYAHPIDWDTTISTGITCACELTVVYFGARAITERVLWQHALSIEWKDALWTFGGLAACLVSSSIVSIAEHAITGSWIGLGVVGRLFYSSQPGYPTLTFALIGIFIGPLLEEFQFRGIFLSAITQRFGPWAGAISSATVFAALHQDAPTFPVLFTNGLILAFVALRTRKLTITAAIHGFINFIAFAPFFFRLMLARFRGDFLAYSEGLHYGQETNSTGLPARVSA